MILRFLQQYRTALVSFCFGLMVMASVGATSFLWIANADSQVGFGNTGCPATFSCQRQTVGVINKIIPQCEVAGYPKIDAARCCNYTLDAFIQLAINIAQLILGMSGSVALIMVMYGGFQYLTSSGDPAKVKAGSGTLFNAGIGLLIIFSSWLIVNFIMASLIATPTGETAPVNTSGGETLNQKLRAIFKNTTSGKTQWEYNASICRKIDFGTVGEVDELPTTAVPVSPGGTAGAGAFIPQTAQQVHTNQSWAECTSLCSAVRVNDQTPLGGPFVAKFGNITPTNGLSVLASQVNDKTTKQSCTCQDYTKLSGTTFSGSALLCGSSAKMGDQQWYGVDCSSAPKPALLQPTNTYQPESWLASQFQCWRPGTTETGSGEVLKKFVSFGGAAPSCQPLGFCCAQEYEYTEKTSGGTQNGGGVIIKGWFPKEGVDIKNTNIDGKQTTYTNCRRLASLAQSSSGAELYNGEKYAVKFCPDSCSIDGCNNAHQIKVEGTTQLLNVNGSSN